MGFKIQLKTQGVQEISRALRHLSSDIKAINKRSLMKVGLKAERIAVLHLQSQDLSWPALNTKYKSRKIEQGFSDKILIRTSTYLQSISSEATANSVSVGVRRDAKTADGQLLYSIASVLEFGSVKRGIPARPLWGPSLRELAAWLADSKFFQTEIINGLRKKYGAGGAAPPEVELVAATASPRVASQSLGPVHTGSRGGQFHLSPSGGRRYLKR